MTALPCETGHSDARTVEYKQYLYPTVNGVYVVLCRYHAKSRRALGYRLVPLR